MSDEEQEDREFTTRIGPIDIDWPRTVGFYGGLGAAVALEMIVPELALFVAAVPFLKLLKRKNATTAERAVAAVLEGAAKPVGGDAEATIRPAYIDDEKAEKSGHGATRPADFGRSARAAVVELIGSAHKAASWLRRAVARQKETLEDVAAEGRARFEETSAARRAPPPLVRPVAKAAE